MKLSLKKILKEFRAAKVTVKIEKNHGHEMIVDSEDVSLGSQQRYDITGKSDHPHIVDLTPDNFEALAAGDSVEVFSSEDKGHVHKVVLNSKPFRQDFSLPDQPRNALINKDGPTRKKGY